MVEFLIAMGVPTAVTGLLVWSLKKHIDKKDVEREENEKAKEKLMLIIMKNSRATNVLAEATARAIQRIPDAHCNGDMTSALEQAAAIQQEEKEFLLNQGIKHIFNEN